MIAAFAVLAAYATACSAFVYNERRSWPEVARVLFWIVLGALIGMGIGYLWHMALA